MAGTPSDTLGRTRYRVVQEGLTNTAKHAPGSGFGPLGRGERVTLAAGTLDHGPAPDGGYVLTARLPWPRQPQER